MSQPEVPSAVPASALPAPARFRSVATESLARRVARAIAASILLGHFRPGEPLPSSGDLAREFEVSKPVVREALKVVATLGMVESRQGRFSRVTERASWNDLSAELLAVRLEIGVIDDIVGDSLELRRVIETEAAAGAAERATQDEIAVMRRHLDALGDSVDDAAAYAGHDIAFHEAVLRATHNRLFLQLIDQMRELLVLARTVSVTASPDRIPDSQEGHRAVFEAIVARSPEAARRSMADHLAWAEKANVEAYRAAHPDAGDGGEGPDGDASPGTSGVRGRPSR